MSSPVGKRIIQGMIESGEDYYLTAMSAEGSAEFLFRDGEFHLLNERAADIWPRLLASPLTTYHLRPAGFAFSRDMIHIPLETMENVHGGISRPAKPIVPERQRPTERLDERELIRPSETEAANRPPLPIKLDPLRDQPFWIGRGGDNDLTIDDPSVSRRHCSLTVTSGPKAKVVDNDSANGVFVDDHPVPEAVVSPHQVFHLGHVPVKVVFV